MTWCATGGFPRARSWEGGHPARLSHASREGLAERGTCGGWVAHPPRTAGGGKRRSRRQGGGDES